MSARVFLHLPCPRVGEFLKASCDGCPELLRTTNHPGAVFRDHDRTAGEASGTCPSAS